MLQVTVCVCIEMRFCNRNLLFWLFLFYSSYIGVSTIRIKIIGWSGKFKGQQYIPGRGLRAHDEQDGELVAGLKNAASNGTSHDITAYWMPKV